MSMESAKAFIERMKTDEEFAKKVADCVDYEARMAFAVANSFEFAAEELKVAASLLTEEDLDKIAGGGLSYCIPLRGALS